METINTQICKKMKENTQGTYSAFQRTGQL